MRKPAFCICIKERHRSAVWYQRLCFYCIDGTILLSFKPLVIFCGCTVWFVSYLVGNPIDRFSGDMAQMVHIVSYLTDLLMSHTVRRLSAILEVVQVAI